MESSLEPPNPVAQAEFPKREPLAVVGIGCRLPGGIDSAETFWDALLSRVDAIRNVPGDRWTHDRFHDTNPEKSGCIRNAQGGFIDGVDQFDAEFFGYFPNQAQRLDPQQRLLLEVTHEAMEDAGLRRDELDGSRTSVFVGSFMYDYLCIQTASQQRDEINPYVAMGVGITSLANRISYNFNLKGPSVSLDTACSSSLTALHLACRSIWDGDAELAIAGGVNVMLRPESSIMMSKAGFLSPDQYCKAFDTSANGYVRSEGVGVVILKPLYRARADGDAIYACVHGTAANQDGYITEGFTVPNVFSQVALLRAAYAEAGIDPLTVDFVEAHGTGTPVGDPVEAAALGSVLGGERTSRQPNLMIGSVKTNLGHLEGAAGIAGFIKGVLTAHHGVAPPNLHFHEPNSEIPWEHYRLEVPIRPTPLKERGHRPVTVGVNSFGAGGSNVHVVLQEWADVQSARQQLASTNGRNSRATVYTLSAANADALRELAVGHARFLSDNQHRLDDIAYSAFTRRSHYENLLAVVGDSAKEVEDRLRSFADGQVDPTVLTATITRRQEPKLGFVFSGQGGQWARMGVQLIEREEVFRQSMEEIESLFQDLAGWSLLAELRKEEGESNVNSTVVVQPAVMAVQIAMVKLYAHYGIQPTAVVGHSIGEVAAAYAAGALTLDQAVEVIYHRSQAQNRAAGNGGMLAVGLSPDEACKLIEGHDGVSIGAVNGPQMLTLSGDLAPLGQIAEMLEARGVFNRPVKVEVAYHSHHMEPIEGIMLESLAHVQGVEATRSLYSTVTGGRVDGLHLNGDYWFQNVRQPVRFTDALSAMLKDGFDTFVEIGPHPVLVRGAEALIQQRNVDAVAAPSMTRRVPEVTVFLQSLARLAARGLEPDVEVMFGSGRRYVRLPKHPWRHERYWFESPDAAEMRRGRFDHPFLKRQTQLVTEQGLAVWEAALGVHKFPYLRDHQIDGEVVFPGTGHIELAWAVANEQFRHESFFLENLHFDLPLIFPQNSRHPLEVRLEIVSGEGDYHICSRPADADAESPWSRHSSGRINAMHDRFERSKVSLADLQQTMQGLEPGFVEQFYENLRVAGLDYGETFRCIQELRHQGHDWLAKLTLPDALVSELNRNYVPPALLDACLHVMFADGHLDGYVDRVYLPYRIGRVRFYRRPTQHVWSYVRVTRRDEQYLCVDAVIFDDAGGLVAELVGVTSKRVVAAGPRPAETSYEGCYEYHWVPAAHDPDLHGRVFDCTHVVLIADATGLADELAARLAADNIQPLIIPFDGMQLLDKDLSAVPLDRRTLIVFAAGLSSSQSQWKGLAACPYVASLLQTAQTLHKLAGVPRLVVATNGAGAVPGDRKLDLGQATLHGMARVINSEWPNVPVRVIDLSAAIAPCEIDAFQRELLHRRFDQDESEIALRGTRRFVRQLVPVDREIAERAAISDEKGCGGAYRADVTDPGVLDQIAFRRLPPSELGESEVEIAVQAAALNFKDIMNAMGLLPENAVSGGLAGSRLGLEVAGRVLRSGALVHDVRVGDEVIARVADGFAGRVTASADCVARKPGCLTPQQAAAVPVVYVTAWYSLCQLARLAPGETLLIHSAAGGVGGAAIRLAQRIGANVIVTAGTKEKREYLRQIGVDHVFDSRSLDFFNDVMEVTGGRGVDVVLNSLTGRFIAQSLKCLAPFGRFVELGKADIYRNYKLGLEHLGENISYFAVDVDRLAAQRPELHRHVMTEVVAMFDRGELQPPEITEFPISKLPEALRFMTRGAHRGKIVVNMLDDHVPTLPPRAATFRPDRGYLISGGATGFGLEVARWMADRGARHLALLSRSGSKSVTDEAVIDAMKEIGVDVELVNADVTDADAVRKVIRRINSGPHPLAGVIHGAAVLDDATIPTMDMDRFERVFKPKAQGAWNLHVATLDAGVELDFFLMLSSISSVLGIVGQLNYAAANYFQDALAHFRHQQGLPATSVNLGVLGQYAGMSKAENDEHDIIGLLESQGIYAMPLPDVLAKLEAIVTQRPVQRMAARLDWPWFRLAYPHLARDSRFIEMMSDAALARSFHSKGTGLIAELAAMEPDVRLQRLKQELVDSLARILGADPEKIDVNASLDNYGLDSLMLTDLQVSIVRALDVNLPLMKLLKGPSITTLAADLLLQLDSGEVAGETSSDEADEASVDFSLADLNGVSVINPWLLRGAGGADAAVRLICFHSMGVGASLFRSFLLNPPADYDILAVQTPGRENRRDEPVAASVDELADQIVPHLSPLLDRPVVMWGHSFGGLVAREVVRRLRDRDQYEPVHFLVTGTIAPHLIDRWKNREVILKSVVGENSAEYLISMSRYVDDPKLIKAILPGLRRDYPLLKSYRFQNMAPLTCPITALAARQDEVVYTDEVAQWHQHTNGGFDLIEVDGDHWFLDRNRELIIQTLRDIAGKLLQRLVDDRVQLPTN